MTKYMTVQEMIDFLQSQVQRHPELADYEMFLPDNKRANTGYSRNDTRKEFRLSYRVYDDERTR